QQPQRAPIAGSTFCLRYFARWSRRLNFLRVRRSFSEGGTTQHLNVSTSVECLDVTPLPSPRVTLPAYENRFLRGEDALSRIFRCRGSKPHPTPRPKSLPARDSVYCRPPNKPTTFDHRI